MDRKTAKKRMRIVKTAIRNATGIERIKLETEIETLTFIIERG